MALPGVCRTFSGGMPVKIVFFILVGYIIDNHIDATGAEILQGTFDYLADAESPGCEAAQLQLPLFQGVRCQRFLFTRNCVGVCLVIDRQAGGETVFDALPGQLPDQAPVLPC